MPLLWVSLAFMLGILLAGAMGYRNLPVSELPNVDFPTIQVSASLPGANPENMASSVATPLEREFTTIEGLDSMTSTSVPTTSIAHSAIPKPSMTAKARYGLHEGSGLRSSMRVAASLPGL